MVKWQEELLEASYDTSVNQATSRCLALQARFDGHDGKEDLWSTEHGAKYLPRYQNL